MRLSNIIILGFVFVAITASFGGIFFIYNHIDNYIQEQISTQFLATAQAKAEHIETYLEDGVDKLLLITSRTQLRQLISNYNSKPDENLQSQMTKVMVDSISSLDEFERLCIVSNSGIIIASTDSGFVGNDIHDKYFFKEGIKNTGVYFIEEDGEVKILFYGPFVLNNTVIGVAFLIEKTDELSEIKEEKTGLGQSGELIVATTQENGSRLFIFPREHEDQALDANDPEAKYGVSLRAALNKQEKVFNNVLDYRGINVLTVSQYIPLGNVGLVAKIDYDEAFGVPRKDIMRNAFFISSLLTIFVLLISVLISKALSIPIERLKADVDEITKGKLDIQLKKSRIIEVQRLTDSLNRILTSMKLAILRSGFSKEDTGLGEAIKAKEEAENKFKSIYECSRDAIMILEPPTWKFTAGNPATLALFGAKNEKEFTSKKPTDLSPRKQPDGQLSELKAKKMIEIALKDESNLFEWTHQKCNGQTFPAIVLLTKMVLNGKAVLQATVRDITKEKDNENKLKESESRVRRIMDGFTKGLVFYSFNTKGLITYISPSIKDTLGYTPEEFKKNFRDFMPKSTFNKKALSMGALGVKMLKQEPIRVELYDKQKNVHLIEAREILVRDSNGKIVGVEGIAQDITEKVVDYQMYKELFQNIDDCVAVYRPVEDGKDFIFVDFNHAAEKTENVKKKDIIGKRVTKVFPGVEKSGILEMFRKTFKTGKPSSWKTSIYQDKRLGKSYRQNYVYRLPLGEIVAVYKLVKE
jgi:PAS domain S-box-containing protein